MKTKITGLYLFILICIFCVPRVSSAQSVKKEILYSTAELEITSAGDDSENSSTVVNSTCTAVAFAKNGNKYRFFTAAHCVSKYDRKLSKTVFKESVLQLNLEKPNGERVAYKAKGVRTGELSSFEDFAILEIESDEDIPILSISKSDPELGEDVLVVTDPSDIDIGFLKLRGYVSRTKINNLAIKVSNNKVEVVAKNKANSKDTFYMDAAGAFGIQVIGLGKGFGTSGGGVFSVKRNAIVGIVSATNFNDYGHVTLLICPISKFNDFLKKGE